MQKQAQPYDEVESLVAAWGIWARRHTERLGLPYASSISRMIDQARVFERKKKGDDNKPDLLTAQGKQTRVMTALKIGHVEPDIMRMDKIVAGLPAIYHIAISRRYLYQQPDRIAARQLHMNREDYTNRVNTAIRYIADRLAFAI